DLTLDIDLSAAARSDKVIDTVSYDKVVDCASRTFTAQKFRLIEAAAGSVADGVLAAFPRVKAVTVTIHKPHAPIAATVHDVAVTFVRSRKCPRRCARKPISHWAAMSATAARSSTGRSRCCATARRCG